MCWDTSSVPKVFECFSFFNMQRPHSGEPARVDQGCISGSYPRLTPLEPQPPVQCDPPRKLRSMSFKHPIRFQSQTLNASKIFFSSNNKKAVAFSVDQHMKALTSHGINDFIVWKNVKHFSPPVVHSSQTFYWILYRPKLIPAREPVSFGNLTRLQSQ